MKPVLIGILLLTFLIVIAVFINDYIIKRKFRSFIRKKYNSIQGLRQKLDAEEYIGEEQIMKLVEQPALRQAVFQVLNSYHRSELFPANYYSYEKGAESYLVTWLEFPTELGRAPDEIEFLTTVMLEDRVSTYYVFKYKTDEPRWAAKLNWMMGVAGPYTPNNLPYDVPKRIFSRFNTPNRISPEEEVKWVHENINQR